ncbi:MULTISPECIES: zinc-dependent alcohol dehydrogenase family protein [Marinomonas]|uniref:NAD(P)-dependent alcohol dehydrogenase n=1 Tax=Marinomonas arctica TaxID=383750 RepID=A0A7H1J1L4_9GAMM|nr:MULTISPECIES: NAD(P)-dependent alcohol dehydrogenase [Marinomonas]MCS7488053.1 alcohol dehydrogenase [Marinomonas sp. BSi20414]QNT04380.1 NAD(P)-dependent alcohol dehydrogenase [Marinomonas arctica]GGN31584.1 NADPH:quinone oxidoreductase [Marinomonas arctica]
MKAFQIGKQHSNNTLSATTRPEPVAGPGEAIIAPRLVSLISRDIQVLTGTYGPLQDPKRVPGTEGVGDVIAIGEGVTEVSVGDRVVCGHFANWLDGPFSTNIFNHDIGITHDGWLAEQVLLPAAALIRLPDNISDEDAAVMASAGLTAWHALTGKTKVKAGDTVLCLGTGGVSLAALNVAKMHGARVAITSSSDEKLAVARKLGADITIDYKTHPDWAAELMKQTNNHGADIILETGGQDTLGHSINAAAANGQIVVIGVAPGSNSPIPNYTMFILKNIVIKGIANGSRAMFVDYINALATNDRKALIAKTFDFDQAPQAYQYFAQAKHIGKVLIKF